MIRESERLRRRSSQKTRDEWNKTKAWHKDICIFAGLVVGAMCLFLVSHGGPAHIVVGVVTLLLLVGDITHPSRPIKPTPRHWHD